MPRETEAGNESRRGRERIALGVILAAGVLLTGTAFVAFREMEYRRARQEFQAVARERQNAVVDALQERLFVLRAVRSMYRASQFVDREEFATFTSLYLYRVSGIETLAWVPRVPAGQREVLEQRARKEGLAAFRIVERDANGRLVPAEARQEYYPILYAQPGQEKDGILGFDTASEIPLRDAMFRARDEDRITATMHTAGKLPLPPETILFVVPWYEKQQPTNTVEERRTHLTGFLLGGFHLPAVVRSALAPAEADGESRLFTPADIRVELHLETENADPPPSAVSTGWKRLFAPEFHWSSDEEVEIGGGRWHIRCTSSPHSFVALFPAGGLWSLLVGSLSTTFAAVYLRNLFRRERRVRELVDQRTAELRAEVNARLAAETHLRDALNFREKLLDISLTGVFTVDPRCRITSVNQTLLDMTGYTREELVGKNCSVLSCSSCGEECTLFDPRRTVPVRNIECIIRSRDGRRISLRKNAEVLRDPSGRIVGAVECVVDVTEFYQARQDAQAAAEAKSEFLTRMNHEIRTPMTCVIGMMELALQTDLTEEQRRYLTMSLSSAETLSRMMNDILEYANLEAGTLELEDVDFRLRDCLDQTLGAIRFAAQRKNLELVGEIAPEVPDCLRGDPVRLRQVLTNLIDNAVKFTDAGRVVVSVDVQSRDSREVHLRFCVRDTGPGISRERQAKIFEAFEQGNDPISRRYGGAGLGLSIALQLVHLMGGKVWVESEVGQGAAFSFLLPLRHAGSEPAGDAAHPPKDLAGLRVLLADDDATHRFLLEQILSRWGMRPRTVENGRDAVYALQRAARNGSPFLLALLDVNMPDENGFETARRIKDDPLLAETTIVMLSSSGQPDHAARCRMLGISGYLIKPIRQAVLLSTILDVLNITPAVRKTSLPTGMYPDASFEERLNLRVLLAEDNPVNRILAQNALEGLGCRVTMAKNGSEALTIWRNDPHDLILMDVAMPILDGLETTRRIRQEEAARGGHVPIIAMTAYAIRGDRELCLRAGMDAYVAKPVRGDDLLRIIRQTLQALGAATPTEHPS